MKKLLLIIPIAVTAIIGCEQTKVAFREKNIDNANSMEYNPLKTDLNGYSWNECIKGSRACSDFYYKMVFTTKHNGEWVTKYAYSSHKSSRFCLGKLTKCLYIRTDEATLDLENELHLRLFDEFKDFYATTVECILMNANELYLYNDAPIKYLKKSEYTTYMNQHPLTKIMDY